MLILSAFTLFAYLLGSVSAAILTCKLMGLPDPRGVGSSNPGATNVYQYFGKKPAIITLLGDVLKGFIPVYLAKVYGLESLSLSLIALAAVIGHLFPLFFWFKGGKGVATALGVIVALNGYVGAVVVATWLLVLKLFKLSSLSALVTALFTPLFFYLLDEDYLVMSLVLCLMLFWSHRSNIKKIMDGTED